MIRRVMCLSVFIFAFLYCSVRPTATCTACGSTDTVTCPTCSSTAIPAPPTCTTSGPQVNCTGSPGLIPDVSTVGTTDLTATGTVSIDLTAAAGTVTFGTTTYSAVLYNGNYVPEVWRVNPGQTLSVTVHNELPANMPQTTSTDANWTNVHYHGFNVSPKPNSDSVFIEIDSGQDPFQYLVNIPATHPEGMFWFHPHPHGISEPQVIGGMSGVAIVNGLLERHYASFAGVTERVFLLKDFLTGPVLVDDKGTPHLPLGPGQSLLKTINGQACPGIIPIDQNETQLWDFGNVGADAFYNLALTDSASNPVSWNVVAIDGNPIPNQARTDPTLDLPPGRRMQVLAQFPAPGRYTLAHRKVDTGPAGDCNPDVLLGYVDVAPSGRPSTPVAAGAQATASPKRPTLGELKLAASQTFNVVFGEDANGVNFCINNQTYCPSRLDKEVLAPSVERWVIQNATDELHVFHIHQLDYVIEAVGNVVNPDSYATYQDTVTVPARTAVDSPGQVTILIPFDPAIAGNFVYHCHILGHEDLGMMANICVYTKDQPCQQPSFGKHMTGHGHSGSH
jgi:suppressor of ftsI